MVIGILIIAYSAVPYLSARSAYRQPKTALASARVDDAITKACSGTKPLQLHSLFELNRRQLDEYQLITRKQQRTAFTLAQIASLWHSSCWCPGSWSPFRRKATPRSTSPAV